MAVLLQLLAILAVTSATAERSFSSTMSEERLNGLALANIHKDLNIDVQEIVELFCTEKPCRLESLDWSQ